MRRDEILRDAYAGDGVTEMTSVDAAEWLADRIVALEQRLADYEKWYAMHGFDLKPLVAERDALRASYGEARLVSASLSDERDALRAKLDDAVRACAEFGLSADDYGGDKDLADCIRELGAERDTLRVGLREELARCAMPYDTERQSRLRRLLGEESK